MLLKFFGSFILAVALLAPAGASADGDVVNVTAGATVTFTGTGAGHGVGMSQWGARGRALAGQSAGEILAAYYPGTTVTMQGDDSQQIRVLLPSGHVQTLALGDYLASAVSSELPPGFPTAAVQAQAIASRTFALWERNPAKTYDVTSTVSTQAFGAAARPEAIAAVGATRGQVLTYNGQVIAAYFHDCSIGMTEDNENVWPGSPQPYLRAINDVNPAGVPYAEGCPRQHWQAGPFSSADLTRILSADPRTDVGTVTALAFGTQSAAGRWVTVTILGDGGSRTVTLAVFRAVMDAGAPVSRTIFSADFTWTPAAATAPAAGTVASDLPNTSPSRLQLENGLAPTPGRRIFSFVL